MPYRIKTVVFCCLLLCCYGNAWPDTCFIGCECSGTTIECRGLQREYFPENFNQGTEVLRIKDSRISYIQRNALAKMRRLQVLEISSSEIKYIQTCAFAGISNFTAFIFSRNNITTIVQNAFAVVENVNEVVFEDSLIKTVSTRAFTKVRNVTTFRLSNLTVNSLQREAIDDVGEIVDFQVVSNRFKYVGQSPFSNMSNVTLNISSNVFPSHCGVGDIFSENVQQESVIIHFQNNVIKSCACNMSLLRVQVESVVDQNTCSGPPEVEGIIFSGLSETQFCRDSRENGVTPLWCPVTRQMPLRHNCHAFGSPLIPQMEVEDPNLSETVEDDNNGAQHLRFNLYMFSNYIYIFLLYALVSFLQ